jgi:uncharacterized FlgJ-related protein
MSIEKSIFQAAINNGVPVKLAELITAQAKHESANFTSNVFKQNNNLFGYKYVGQSIASRGTPAPAAEGKSMFYAKYENVADSVTELTNWIKRRQKEKKFPKDLNTIKTPEIYAGLLKASSFYGATLTDYLTGLKKYLKENVQTGISGVAILIIAASFFFITRR